jgi:ribosomal protein S18 acetylase RimI-like enzyme
MLAPALKPPVRALPAIECRPVADASTRLAFAEITSVAFEIPYSVSHAVYTPEQAWKGAYQGYVGLVGGRPACIVAIVAAAGVLGVYSLGTLPAFRRKGYGEALLRAAAADVQKRTGFERLVLQSTEAGYSLYKRLGFRDTTRFTVYLTK